MWKRLAIVAIAAGVIASARPAAAQTTAQGSDKLAWTIQAPDLATAQGYTYRHYDDTSATGVVLVSVVCAPLVPALAGSFECEAPFPAFVSGAHTVAVTAANADGESLKSVALAFRFVIIPAVPTNLHKK